MLVGFCSEEISSSSPSGKPLEEGVSPSLESPSSPASSPWLWGLALPHTGEAGEGRFS